jgi:hypothetical protein
MLEPTISLLDIFKMPPKDRRTSSDIALMPHAPLTPTWYKAVKIRLVSVALNVVDDVVIKKIIDAVTKVTCVPMAHGHCVVRATTNLTTSRHISIPTSIIGYKQIHRLPTTSYSMTWTLVATTKIGHICCCNKTCWVPWHDEDVHFIQLYVHDKIGVVNLYLQNICVCIYNIYF